MRQQLQTLLILTLVIVLGLVGYRLLFDDDAAGELLVVSAKDAQVVSEHAPDGETMVSGMEISVRDLVHTGEAGNVSLQFGDAGQVHLQSASSMRILSASKGGVRIELQEGAVSARVRPGSPPLGITNRGRAVHATEADFTVVVDLEGALSARAEQGTVQLRGFDGPSSLSVGGLLRALPGKPAIMDEIPESLLLEVVWPLEDVTRDAEVVVQGRTDPYAAIDIEHGSERTKIRAAADGRFRTAVGLLEGENLMRVRARDVMGREAEAAENIRRDSTAPVVEDAQVVWGE